MKKWLCLFVVALFVMAGCADGSDTESLVPSSPAESAVDESVENESSSESSVPSVSEYDTGAAGHDYDRYAPYLDEFFQKHYDPGYNVPIDYGYRQTYPISLADGVQGNLLYFDTAFVRVLLVDAGEKIAAVELDAVPIPYPASIYTADVSREYAGDEIIVHQDCGGNGSSGFVYRTDIYAMQDQKLVPIFESGDLETGTSVNLMDDVMFSIENAPTGRTILYRGNPSNYVYSGIFSEGANHCFVFDRDGKPEEPSFTNIDDGSFQHIAFRDVDQDGVMEIIASEIMMIHSRYYYSGWMGYNFYVLKYDEQTREMKIQQSDFMDNPTLDALSKAEGFSYREEYLNKHIADWFSPERPDSQTLMAEMREKRKETLPYRDWVLGFFRCKVRHENAATDIEGRFFAQDDEEKPEDADPVFSLKQEADTRLLDIAVPFTLIYPNGMREERVSVTKEGLLWEDRLYFPDDPDSFHRFCKTAGLLNPEPVFFLKEDLDFSAADVEKIRYEHRQFDATVVIVTDRATINETVRRLEDIPAARLKPGQQADDRWKRWEFFGRDMNCTLFLTDGTQFQLNFEGAVQNRQGETVHYAFYNNKAKDLFMKEPAPHPRSQEYGDDFAYVAAIPELSLTIAGHPVETYLKSYRYQGNFREIVRKKELDLPEERIPSTRMVPAGAYSSETMPPQSECRAQALFSRGGIPLQPLSVQIRYYCDESFYTRDQYGTAFRIEAFPFEKYRLESPKLIDADGDGFFSLPPMQDTDGTCLLEIIAQFEEGSVTYLCSYAPRNSFWRDDKKVNAYIIVDGRRYQVPTMILYDYLIEPLLGENTFSQEKHDIKIPFQIEMAYGETKLVGHFSADKIVLDGKEKEIDSSAMLERFNGWLSDQIRFYDSDEYDVEGLLLSGIV